MSTAKKVTVEHERMSQLANSLLVILLWERDRLNAVTVTEVTERLKVDVDAVKAAFNELYARGLVDATLTLQ